MTDRMNGVIHYLSVVMGLLSFNQWVSLFMALLAAGTFIGNIYFKKRMLDIAERKLEREENNE